jgi:hypothetical protein
MTPEEKRLDKYYWKKFGWTFAEIDALEQRQNRVCAICHRPPGKVRLSVDHDHAYDRVKLYIERLPDWSWAAFTDPETASAIAIGESRKEARRMGRFWLRRKSVRGLLCFRCNRGIQLFEDSKAPLSPCQRFDNAAAYFRQFQSKSS